MQSSRGRREHFRHERTAATFSWHNPLKDKLLREHNQADDNCQRHPPAQPYAMLKISNVDHH
jgi:hypothetical protein